jgi:hypothetical protein
MGWLWWVGAIAIVAWVVALVDIIRGRHRFTTVQLFAWILMIIILPVVGTILYFVVGRKTQPQT